MSPNCKAWSWDGFNCYLLSSCERKNEKGYLSGSSGCIPASRRISIEDSSAAATINGTISWYREDFCPSQLFSTTWEVPATSTYYEYCGDATINAVLVVDSLPVNCSAYTSSYQSFMSPLFIYSGHAALSCTISPY